MAIIYSIGKNLVSVDEYERLNQQGQISDFIKEPKNKRFEFDLRGSKISCDSLFRTFTLAGGETVEPQPIGIGKPLTVYIQHIYLGDNGKNDLLVTSAIKSIIESKPAPRAINLLIEKAKNKDHVDFTATDLCTPLVYYSPSLTESYTILTIEMILDRFNKEIFDQIGEGMNTAGALPIFATASQFLFAGGAISKLIGKIGESIFDGSPFFRESKKLTFDFAGMPQILSGQILLVNDEHEQHILTNYNVDQKGKLVPKNATIPADVNYPYITIYLDGTPHDEFKKFKPQTDSIDIVDRFFHIKTTNQQMQMASLIDAVSLYNDFSYREKAMNIKNQLDGMSNASPEYKNLKVKYEAILKNIQNDLFKIKEA